MQTRFVRGVFFFPPKQLHAYAYIAVSLFRPSDRSTRRFFFFFRFVLRLARFNCCSPSCCIFSAVVVAMATGVFEQQSNSIVPYIISVTTGGHVFWSPRKRRGPSAAVRPDDSSCFHSLPTVTLCSVQRTHINTKSALLMNSSLETSSRPSKLKLFEGIGSMNISYYK